MVGTTGPLGPGPCAWCESAGPFKANDHVFPQSLGGTQALAVPSCPNCDDEIKRLEERVARSSTFGVKRLTGGPAPRHKKDPASGALVAAGAFADDGDGGLTEVLPLSNRAPLRLPCIQINPDHSKAKLRAESADAMNVLVKKLIGFRESTEDKPADVVMLIMPREGFLANPGFLPRIFEDHRGRVCVRAFSEEEARTTVEFCVRNAERFLQDGSARDGSVRLSDWQIPAGTPIPYALNYRPNDELRIAAKVGLGVAICRLGDRALSGGSVQAVRDSILGLGNADPVTWVRQGQELREWPDHHIALLDVRNGRLRAILIFFGRCYHVDLGPASAGVDPKLLAVAMSRRDGTDTRFVGIEKAQEIRSMIAGALNSTAPPHGTHPGGVPQD